MAMAKDIRPSADHLRQLPTLAVETPADWSQAVQEYAKELGIAFRLELKLVTDRVKYWLCTQGAEKPGDCPDCWVVGYVMMESTEPDEHGEYLRGACGPNDVKRLQWADYCRALDR